MIASGVSNLAYEARRFVATEEKRAIGRAAAELIANGSSLFINIGTTTEEVAEALVGHENMLVITNNLNVAMNLRRRESFEVIVAGGPVRASDGAVVGPAAVDLIRQFKLDVAVVGASAIDPDGSLLDFDYQEVRVAQAIIENARRVILVADRTKHDRTAPVRIAHLEQVHVFVTDYMPSPRLRELCVAKGIRLDRNLARARHGGGLRRGFDFRLQAKRKSLIVNSQAITNVPSVNAAPGEDAWTRPTTSP